MKAIKAYFKKHRFDSVMFELSKINSHGQGGLSTYEVLGYGKGKALNASNAITYELHSLIPSVCVDIFCIDEIVEEITNAIEKGAHTGLKGDGKIFVSNVETAIRISDGKKGESIV